MSAETSQLHLAVLERMLAIAREARPSEAPPPDTVDFDWNAPCHFTRSQMERINKFAATASQKVSEAMTSVLRSPVAVHPEPVTQHFGSHLLSAEGERTNYSVPVNDGTGRACGVLVLTPACASGWVGKLLGGPETAGDERELSVLESTLLSEVVVALSGAFSAASEATGGTAFQVDGQMSRGALDLPGDSAGEFCRIALGKEGSDEAPGVSLLLLSEALDGVAGVESEDRGGTASVDLRAEIAAHLGRSIVTATAWVGTAAASVQEIVALEPGDVLLLQKKVNETIDLAVQDSLVLAGLPVTCDGCYAVQVVVPAGRTARANGALPARPGPGPDRDSLERNRDDG